MYREAHREQIQGSMLYWLDNKEKISQKKELAKNSCDICGKYTLRHKSTHEILRSIKKH